MMSFFPISFFSEAMVIQLYEYFFIRVLSILLIFSFLINVYTRMLAESLPKENLKRSTSENNWTRIREKKKRRFLRKNL